MHHVFFQDPFMLFSLGVHGTIFFIFYMYMSMRRVFLIPPLHACNLHGVFGPVSRIDGQFILFDLAQQQTRVT